MKTFSPLLFILCFQVSKREAMHLIMATIDALDVSADNLVINTTTLQHLREKNRHDQFNEAQADIIDKVLSCIVI